MTMEIVNIDAQTFYKMNGMLENLVLLIKESQMCLHGQSGCMLDDRHISRDA